ncbi:MAG: Rpn family recombination-promoting nuclease/putative transposase [Thermodesulfobacteriota bacterium]|nr:Rpn family recombination-promoting nuclease/putative transposase [Thermodesulfobacteriota bacterium]
MTYVKPTSDIFIRYLFGSEENKFLLLAFINAVLENSDFPRIRTVELKNPFNLKKILYDKESILDVKAVDETGQIFNIEVQTSGSSDFKHRTLYYWAKLYASQLKVGDIYSRLYPAVCINILDFKFFDGFDKYHSTFMVREKDEPEFFLSRHLVIHFLELPKFKDTEKGKRLSHWLYYLKNEGTEDEKMKVLLDENENIEKAHEMYIAFTRDEELIEAYEAREKWKKDYNSGLFNARKEGRQEGKKEGKRKGKKEGKREGKKEGKRETAVKMLKKGFELKTICELTGISIKELQQEKLALKI